MTQSRPLTVATLKRAAARHGGTVEGGVIGRSASYNVDAPDGMIWSSCGLHYLCLGWYAGGPNGAATWPEEKQDALADALERVEHGVEPCQDDECDICDPNPE